MIIDTHVLLWFFAGSPRLSETARSALRTLIAAGQRIAVSCISMVELVYLVEKGRVSQVIAQRIFDEIRRDDDGSAVRVVAFESSMAEAMTHIPRDLVPDMPDRMIAATALHLNLPLVTADAQIRRAPVQTIW